VGEVWVSGPSVAEGYWNRAEETQRTFGAHVAGTGEGPFLRTEDLGFLRDGELFITGRAKDLVILRGRNHYSEDLERTVEESHGSLRPGCIAAFSADREGKELLVIMAEWDAARASAGEAAVKAVAEALQDALWDHHDLRADAIALVAPGTIPKTSSGKIQRFACRAAFLEGRIEVVAGG
jgi:acyl-CoA synthetase (AMP-forming)/AMP-acid ligase II